MALTRKYDVIFGPHKGAIPLAYMRALAWGESRLNPADVHEKSNATGLLQVTRVVLESYNDRHGTSHVMTDLLEPKLNVQIASDTLNRIVRAYKKEGLEPDWHDPDWVGVFTLGWNAGYSKKAGLLKVVAALKKEGLPITLETVAAKAATMKGVVPFLSMPQRVAWAGRVTKKFSDERARDNADSADTLARRVQESKLSIEEQADLIARRVESRSAKPAHEEQVSRAGFPWWLAIPAGAFLWYSSKKARR